MVLGMAHFDSTDAFMPCHNVVNRIQSWHASEDQEEIPILQPGKVSLDNDGSAMTDRFKYKVNALMGTYDPKVGTDDEKQFGNIIGALMDFPAKFAFSVVGRTNGKDEDALIYGQVAKQIVKSISGDSEMECLVSPRGKSFTRLSITTMVESAGMIKAIYDALDAVEATVMKY